MSSLENLGSKPNKGIRTIYIGTDPNGNLHCVYDSKRATPDMEPVIVTGEQFEIIRNGSLPDALKIMKIAKFNNKKGETKSWVTGRVSRVVGV